MSAAQQHALHAKRSHRRRSVDVQDCSTRVHIRRPVRGSSVQGQKTPRRWCASGQESLPASVLRRAFAWSGDGPWLALSHLVRRTSTSRSVDLAVIWTANSPPVPVMAVDLPAIVTHTWWVVIVCKEHAYSLLLFSRSCWMVAASPSLSAGSVSTPRLARRGKAILGSLIPALAAGGSSLEHKHFEAYFGGIDTFYCVFFWKLAL